MVENAGETNVEGRFRRRFFFVAGMAALGLLVVLLLWFQIHVLLLGFSGVLLAVFLYRVATWVASWSHLPYWAALIVTCLVVLGALAGAVWLAGARIAAQADMLQRELPDAWQKLRGRVMQFGWGPWVVDRIGDAWESLKDDGMGAAGLGMVSSSGKVFAEGFTVLFVGLFAAIHPALYVRGLMRLVPPAHRGAARHICEQIGDLLWWWLLGQLLAMAFIGVITGVAMWLLGVPLALTLGLLAALLNFIPNFGPVLAAAPAALLALVQSPMTAVWVVVAYGGIQLLQNHLVTPLVQKSAVRLPPVLLILSQIFMYYWAGVLGMALAPPLAAVGLRLVEILYVQWYLGDPMKKDKGFWPVNDA